MNDIVEIVLVGRLGGSLLAFHEHMGAQTQRNLGDDACKQSLFERFEHQIDVFGRETDYHRNQLGEGGLSHSGGL